MMGLENLFIQDTELDLLNITPEMTVVCPHARLQKAGLQQHGSPVVQGLLEGVSHPSSFQHIYGRDR